MHALLVKLLDLPHLETIQGALIGLICILVLTAGLAIDAWPDDE